MELCEGCDRLIDIKQDEGDYVYYRREDDAIVHPFCNVCLELNDYNESEQRGVKRVSIDPEEELKKLGYKREESPE